MSIWYAVAALILLSVVGGITCAQDRSSSKNGCFLIDPSQPAHFIAYDNKSDSDIHLRLRNNSSCAIVVETDDQYPTQITKLPSKGVRIEPVLDAREGVRLRLHYLIQINPQREPERAYGWGDSVFVYEIPPGQSVTFSVPINRFKRVHNIAVPFGYSWESTTSVGTGIGGIIHRVYFFSDDLPAKALRSSR